MEILKGLIDWNEHWDNGPDIKLIVDKLPNHKDLRYIKRPVLDRTFPTKRLGYIYYAELDDYVNFYYYSSPGEGFGGRRFNLSMEDGSSETLVGPWSSNSMSINSLGLGPCTEVTITDDEKVWRRGYTFYGAAVTVALIERYIDRIGFGAQYARRSLSTNEVLRGPTTLFPDSSVLQILPVKWGGGIHYVPMLMFPDGTLWTKLERDLNNIIEETIENE